MSCITPYTVKDKVQNRSIPVPCGKCPECLKRRISGWSFRLVQEGKRASSAHFITLTYDSKNVPITKKGYMSLDKRDLQLFFKRLRKRHPKHVKIKYYACGEYGTNTNRPHYHIILYNADIVYLQGSWQNGHIDYGTVTGASIGYVLKYMSKPGRIPYHQNDDRSKEFALMSKGLGENYVTPQMTKWHKAKLEDRMYLVIDDGKKIAMPRYYKGKIYTEMERKRIAYFALQTNLENSEKWNKLMEEAHGSRAAVVQVELDKIKFLKLHRDSKKDRDKI